MASVTRNKNDLLDNMSIIMRASGAQIGGGLAVKKGGTDLDEVVVCGAGEAAVGIMESTAPAGRGGPVAYAGTTYAVAGAAITTGDWLKSDANGKLVPTVGEDTNVVARAWSNAAQEDDLVMVEVRPIPKKS